MAEFFDSKAFNGEVFQRYIERIPNPTVNALIQSRAIRLRPELAPLMSDQAGGNYITTPLTGLISGTAAQNYDGSTNITASTTKSYAHSRVVVGRAAAWTEHDFAIDVAGGTDFMANVAEQVADYLNEVDQGILVSVLTGVFAMTSEAGAEFSEAHTLDVTLIENSNGDVGYADATTINSAMQAACGDNKGKFSLVIMHSAVATNLENLNLLHYTKYTDSRGIERDLALGTVNGRLVLVDDSMPTETVEGTDETYTVYTSYVLGDGALEITDCGARVPYEMYRDPATNGGADTLYVRQRIAVAPYGISFTKSSMASLSPTDEELENGANWDLVSSTTSSGTDYIAHKTIPIARILSRG